MSLGLWGSQLSSATAAHSCSLSLSCRSFSLDYSHWAAALTSSCATEISRPWVAAVHCLCQSKNPCCRHHSITAIHSLRLAQTSSTRAAAVSSFWLQPPFEPKMQRSSLSELQKFQVTEMRQLPVSTLATLQQSQQKSRTPELQQSLFASTTGIQHSPPWGRFC